MKNLVGFVFFIVLSNVSFAKGTFNSQNGNYVVQDVDVDGQTFFDSVTLNLDLVNGTFTIVDAQPKAPTVSLQPIQQVETEGFTIGLLGCTRTGEIITLPSGDDRIIDCDIQVVNHQSDRLLRANALLSGSGRPILVDNFSSSAILFKVTSGNQTSTRGSIEILLLQNQPVKISFTFRLNINSRSIASFKPELTHADFTRLTNEVEFFDIDF